MAYVVDAGAVRNPSSVNTNRFPTVRPNNSGNAFVSGAITGSTAGVSNRPSGSTGGSSGSSGGTVTVQQPSGPSYADILAQIQAQQQAARDRAYRAAAEQQRKNLDYSTGQVNNAADKALQEAYINKMMTLKNLPQTLSAQGLTGGVAESTTAGLYNNYGNSRNEIESERLDQIGALQQAYNNNMAQLEAQRASGAAASLSEYAPVLAQLVANNPTELVSMQQGSSMPTSGARLVWDEDLGQWVYR